MPARSVGATPGATAAGWWRSEVPNCPQTTAAWALWTGRRWGRGIAVFTQLLILPVTWYVAVGSHRWFYGIPVAAVALGALLLLFSPAALRWMSNSPAGADNSGAASP